MISQSEKTNPIQTQFLQRAKMNANAFSQKDYENETAFRPQKNKPKQTQFHLPPGEPALLALRLVRRLVRRSFSEGGSAAEGGLAMTFFGAFLQRVAARPEKNVGTMNLLAIKSYKIYLNYLLLLSN
jgi:hypothetical protein